MTRKDFNRLALAARSIAVQSPEPLSDAQFSVVVNQLMLACADLAKGGFDRTRFIAACQPQQK
jgi:hypothetical protein